MYTVIKPRKAVNLLNEDQENIDRIRAVKLYKKKEPVEVDDFKLFLDNLMVRVVLYSTCTD